MKYTVYGCTKCNRRAFHKGNMDRHTRRCSSGAAETATYMVEFSNVTRVDNNRSPQTPMEQFMCNFIGINDSEAKQLRADFLYNRDSYMKFLDIKKAVIRGTDGIVHAFGRFISLFFGNQCVRDEWRSVWISDKNIYLNLARGEPVKYPNDERHKILVLKHMYDIFEWALSPTTMDIYHTTYNRVTDCATSINNTLIAWSEKSQSGKNEIKWKLKDLVSRRHFKSKVQQMMLSNFEGLFWHFSDYHILKNDYRLKYGSEWMSRKVALGERTRLECSESGTAAAAAAAADQDDISVMYEDLSGVRINAYVCDCGKASAHKANMERHKEKCGMNYRIAQFKLVSPSTEIQVNAVSQVLDPRLETYINVQNILCHLPRTDEHTVDDEIVSLAKYDDFLFGVRRKAQASRYSFLDFARVYFGYRIIKKEWTRFWTVSHPTGPLVVYFSDNMSSVSVGTFEEKWHEIFSIIWNLYKFLYNPGQYEPTGFGTSRRSFYENCELFLEHKQSTDDISYVAREIWHEMPNLRIK